MQIIMSRCLFYALRVAGAMPTVLFVTDIIVVSLGLAGVTIMDSVIEYRSWASRCSPEWPRPVLLGNVQQSPCQVRQLPHYGILAY